MTTPTPTNAVRSQRFVDLTGLQRKYASDLKATRDGQYGLLPYVITADHSVFYERLRDRTLVETHGYADIVLSPSPKDVRSDPVGGRVVTSTAAKIIGGIRLKYPDVPDARNELAICMRRMAEVLDGRLSDLHRSLEESNAELLDSKRELGECRRSRSTVAGTINGETPFSLIRFLESEHRRLNGVLNECQLSREVLSREARADADLFAGLRVELQRHRVVYHSYLDDELKFFYERLQNVIERGVHRSVVTRANGVDRPLATIVEELRAQLGDCIRSNEDLDGFLETECAGRGDDDIDDSASFGVEELSNENERLRSEKEEITRARVRLVDELDRLSTEVSELRNCNECIGQIRREATDAERENALLRGVSDELNTVKVQLRDREREIDGLKKALHDCWITTSELTEKLTRLQKEKAESTERKRKADSEKNRLVATLAEAKVANHVLTERFNLLTSVNSTLESLIDMKWSYNELNRKIDRVEEAVRSRVPASEIPRFDRMDKVDLTSPKTFSPIFGYRLT